MSVHPPCEPSQPLSPDSTHREVWILAYPVVFSMLAQTIMGLVDTLFMGWVSTTAQGAVGLGSIVTWTYGSLFIGTLTVVNTFVAQHYGSAERADREAGAGAGDVARRRCGVVAWHGLALAAGFSIVIVATVPALDRLVALFGAPPEVAEITLAYAAIRVLWAAPLRCFEMTLTSFMRGIGDTRTPMKVSLLTVVLNVPLNYWLVFGGLGVPPLGARGAAYATAASLAVGVAVLVVLFSRRRMRQVYGTGWPGRLCRAQLWSLIRVGVPIGVTWILEMVTWTMFTVVVARMGQAQLAAHNIVLQVLHLSFMPGVAIAVAAQTLVGQSLGARDPAGAGQRAYAALRLGVLFMASMALVFLLLGAQIAGLFSRDEQVVGTAQVLFAFAAAFQVFDGMGMISSGVLKGAGDTRWPMVVSIAFAWLVFVPLIWLFGVGLGWGVTGSWAAATAYIVGVGLVLFGRVRGGRWKQLWLIREDPDRAEVDQRCAEIRTATPTAATQVERAPPRP